MVVSTTSRIIGLAVATLLVAAGAEFFLYSHLLERQRISQIAAILRTLPDGSRGNIERLRENVSAVAPGSLVYLLNAKGQPISDGTGLSISAADLSWAHSCISEGRHPCVWHNRIAMNLPSAAFGPTAVMVVTAAQFWPTSLALSLWGIALAASAFLGFGLNYLIHRSSPELLTGGKLTTVSCDQHDESGPLSTAELNAHIQEVEATRNAILSREKTHLEWIAFLSHDLGAPLARMLRHVEAIQYDTTMQPSEQVSALESLHREVTDLAEIVGSVSQFASLDSNIEREFFEVGVADLLERVVEDFEYEASTKGIELELSISGDLGVAKVERSLIRRALENLIVNAIRHTTQGGRITVSAARVKCEIRVTVEDTGTGMPPGQLERIFSFAFQGDCSSRISQVGAGGLGLALVKRVAEIHGGSITANNIEPHGARFILTIRG